MFNRLKERIKKNLIDSYGLRPLYDLSHGGALFNEGWLRSFFTKKPVDSQDNPIPWLTYPALHFIKSRLSPDFAVFEYGCGGSTLWWASLVKEVVSVEHDVDWYRQIKAQIPANVTLFNIPLERGEEYSKKVSEYSQKFDIIVIDGRDRVNCAKNAVRALKPNGVFIWDNSEREEYIEGYNFLFSNGFKRLDFFGMGPINLYSWGTSIFYREENVFGI